MSVAILGVMDEYMDMPSFVCTCTDALSNACFQNENQRALAAKTNAVELLLHAMNHHSTIFKVQLQCSRALANMISDPKIQQKVNNDGFRILLNSLKNVFSPNAILQQMSHQEQQHHNVEHGLAMFDAKKGQFAQQMMIIISYLNTDRRKALTFVRLGGFQTCKMVYQTIGVWDETTRGSLVGMFNQMSQSPLIAKLYLENRYEGYDVLLDLLNDCKSDSMFFYQIFSVITFLTTKLPVDQLADVLIQSFKFKNFGNLLAFALAQNDNEKLMVCVPTLCAIAVRTKSEELREYVYNSMIPLHLIKVSLGSMSMNDHQPEKQLQMDDQFLNYTFVTLYHLTDKNVDWIETFVENFIIDLCCNPLYYKDQYVEDSIVQNGAAVMVNVCGLTVKRLSVEQEKSLAEMLLYLKDARPKLKPLLLKLERMLRRVQELKGKKKSRKARNKNKKGRKGLKPLPKKNKNFNENRIRKPAEDDPECINIVVENPYADDQSLARNSQLNLNEQRQPRNAKNKRKARNVSNMNQNKPQQPSEQQSQYAHEQQPMYDQYGGRVEQHYGQQQYDQQQQQPQQYDQQQPHQQQPQQHHQQYDQQPPQQHQQDMPWQHKQSTHQSMYGKPSQMSMYEPQSSPPNNWQPPAPQNYGQQQQPQNWNQSQRNVQPQQQWNESQRIIQQQQQPQNWNQSQRIIQQNNEQQQHQQYQQYQNPNQFEQNEEQQQGRNNKIHKQSLYGNNKWENDSDDDGHSEESEDSAEREKRQLVEAASNVFDGDSKNKKKKEKKRREYGGRSDERQQQPSHQQIPFNQEQQSQNIPYGYQGSQQNMHQPQQESQMQYGSQGSQQHFHQAQQESQMQHNPQYQQNMHQQQQHESQMQYGGSQYQGSQQHFQQNPQESQMQYGSQYQGSQQHFVQEQQVPQSQRDMYGGGGDNQGYDNAQVQQQSNALNNDESSSEEDQGWDNNLQQMNLNVDENRGQSESIQSFLNQGGKNPKERDYIGYTQPKRKPMKDWEPKEKKKKKKWGVFTK